MNIATLSYTLRSRRHEGRLYAGVTPFGLFALLLAWQVVL